MTIEDLDWEEWLKLTEAQQDAIVAREMATYQRWLDGLTVRQQVAHHRRCELRGIMENGDGYKTQSSRGSRSLMTYGGSTSAMRNCGC